MQPMPIVGVYCDQPETVLRRVRRLVPDASLRVCRQWDELDRITDEIEVLLAFKFNSMPFPRDVILAAPRLRWVQLSSAGSDHLMPLGSGCPFVTRASGIDGDLVAQYVMATTMAMLWGLRRLIRQQDNRQWTRYGVSSLAGRTVGIIGAGLVGTVVAERARAFGTRVIGIRRSGRPVPGFDSIYGPDGLIRLIRESDVVVLTVPLTPETCNLLGPSELAYMRRSAVLVNTSRGGIVDEQALLDALLQRRLAGAVLDVFALEPLPPNSPFWSLSNVLVTPHIAGGLSGRPVAVAQLFCDNLQRWLDGAPLQHIVDPVAGY